MLKPMAFPMFLKIAELDHFYWLDLNLQSLFLPTKLLTKERTKFDIDGVEVEIVHAPGETTDQIFIYLPKQRWLLPADNIYRTFPNIYAIRGTPTRDARDWVKSLDKMRSLRPKPKYLVPSHTRPVIG